MVRYNACAVSFSLFAQLACHLKAIFLSTNLFL
jgi:hypothetical protein